MNLKLDIDITPGCGQLHVISFCDEPILFSDAGFNYPWTNPIIFDGIGKLPKDIYIRPGIPFVYLILNKDNKFIKWGRFKAITPIYSKVMVQ